jgi:hypothetical protein
VAFRSCSEWRKLGVVGERRDRAAAATISMEAFKLVYLEKCRDFVTTPIEPLLLAVSVAIDAGVVISNFVLNGNSKELFNNRLQYMQVGAFAQAGSLRHQLVTPTPS